MAIVIGRQEGQTMRIGRLLAATCIGAALVLSACSQQPGSPINSSAASSAPASDTVVYTVTGAASDMITYQNSTGDTAQVTDLTSLPWTISFTVSAGTEGFLYVSAQNAGYGAIGCSISINGQVVKQNTSSGQYAIVDCSG